MPTCPKWFKGLGARKGSNKNSTRCPTGKAIWHDFLTTAPHCPIEWRKNWHWETEDGDSFIKEWEIQFNIVFIIAISVDFNCAREGGTEDTCHFILFFSNMEPAPNQFMKENIELPDWYSPSLSSSSTVHPPYFLQMIYQKYKFNSYIKILDHTAYKTTTTPKWFSPNSSVSFVLMSAWYQLTSYLINLPSSVLHNSEATEGVID